MQKSLKIKKFSRPLLRCVSGELKRSENFSFVKNLKKFNINILPSESVQTSIFFYAEKNKR